MILFICPVLPYDSHNCHLLALEDLRDTFLSHNVYNLVSCILLSTPESLHALLNLQRPQYKLTPCKCIETVHFTFTWLKRTVSQKYFEKPIKYINSNSVLSLICIFFIPEMFIIDRMRSEIKIASHFIFSPY